MHDEKETPPKDPKDLRVCGECGWTFGKDRDKCTHCATDLQRNVELHGTPAVQSRITNTF